MVSTILAFLVGALKCLPAVLEFISEMQKAHAAKQETERQANALQRFQDKRKMSQQYIADVLSNATNKLRDDTATFTRSSQAGQRTETP